jgi:hypothetical protein
MISFRFLVLLAPLVAGLGGCEPENVVHANLAKLLEWKGPNGMPRCPE